MLCCRLRPRPRPGGGDSIVKQDRFLSQRFRLMELEAQHLAAFVLELSSRVECIMMFRINEYVFYLTRSAQNNTILNTI